MQFSNNKIIQELGQRWANYWVASWSQWQIFMYWIKEEFGNYTRGNYASNIYRIYSGTENIHLPLCFTNEVINERTNNAKFNTSTLDFTASMPLQESIRIKTAVPKVRDLTELHDEEGRIKFSLHNTIELNSDKVMSNTIQILLKKIGDDSLVFLFNQARNIYENLDDIIESHHKIIAKPEVINLPLSSNLKNELKIIENETLPYNGSIALKPGNG